MTHGFSPYHRTKRAVAVMGVAAASALSLSGCSADGEVITAPMVMSPISDGSAQLAVPWTKQEAESLAASLVG